MKANWTARIQYCYHAGWTSYMARTFRTELFRNGLPRQMSSGKAWRVARHPLASRQPWKSQRHVQEHVSYAITLWYPMGLKCQVCLLDVTANAGTESRPGLCRIRKRMPIWRYLKA
eukprot:141366-Pleurochrysis_carterae.AAC.3